MTKKKKAKCKCSYLRTLYPPDEDWPEEVSKKGVVRLEVCKQCGRIKRKVKDPSLSPGKVKQKKSLRQAFGKKLSESEELAIAKKALEAKEGEENSYADD